MPIFSDGEVVLGGSEIERFLGSGPASEVYRVLHPALGRVALKVVSVASEEEAAALFADARFLSKLGDARIARVLESGALARPAAPPLAYALMDYFAAGNLEQLWRSYGSVIMPVERAVRIAAAVAGALGVAHAQAPPIVHRGLTLANVLVAAVDDAGGVEARVADFGLARRVSALSAASAGALGRALLAPELVAGGQAPTPASDVYAAGAILHVLLTDRAPEEAGARAAPPSARNPLVDARLDAIVERALARRPEDRLADGGALAAALAAWDPAGAIASGADVAPAPPGAAALAEARAALALAAGRQGPEPAAEALAAAIARHPALGPEWGPLVEVWRRGLVA